MVRAGQVVPSTSGAPRATEVVIVALPPVSMSGLGPIVDTLRLANEIDGRLLYRWRICSWDGRAVPLEGGATLAADGAFGDGIACDWLIVVTERFQQFADYRLFLASLARVGQRTPLVTGIHHGVWWLAMAGQLSGYRVSVNWETYQQFAEQFERSIVTQQLFEIDRDRAARAVRPVPTSCLPWSRASTARSWPNALPTRWASACCAQARSVSAFRTSRRPANAIRGSTMRYS
jgi:AraC family transcriptional regulator, L-arginine-responsive activator